MMDVRHEDSSSERLIVTTESQVNPPLLLRATVDAPQAEEPSTSHGIRWLEGTVDNEFLGRKKSNCCCIYKKPRRWDESSSSSSSSSDSSDNEGADENKPARHTRCTEHCRGHTKHCYRKKTAQPPESQQVIQPPSDQTPDENPGTGNPSPHSTPNHSIST